MTDLQQPVLVSPTVVSTTTTQQAVAPAQVVEITEEVRPIQQPVVVIAPQVVGQSIQQQIVDEQQKATALAAELQRTNDKIARLRAGIL